MDPVARMLAVAEACLQLAEARPGRYRLIPTAVLPAERDAFAYLREACRAAIEQDELRSELSDATELAEILWATLHELIAQCVVMAERDRIPWPDLRAAARHAMSTVIHGIRREPLAHDRVA